MGRERGTTRMEVARSVFCKYTKECTIVGSSVVETALQAQGPSVQQTSTYA